MAISHEDSEVKLSTQRRVRRSTVQNKGQTSENADESRQNPSPERGEGEQGESPGHHRALKLSLQAFGKRLRLNLMKNEDFQKRVEGLKMYTMSSTSKGGVYYSFI